MKSLTERVRVRVRPHQMHEITHRKALFLTEFLMPWCRYLPEEAELHIVY